jgi:arsenate reductase
MAEGILKSFDPELSVHSAGTNPSGQVHPKAVKVMAEIGIDISGQKPKPVDLFINQPFDYVITVCDNAREACPVFTGKVNNLLHIGFEDPAEALGTDEEITVEFRMVRDKIKADFREFFNTMKKEK